MVFQVSRQQYSVDDFASFAASGTLVITPKFQRKAVWKTTQRSYLIDTIIQGLPVPSIYLRTRFDDEKKRTVREVVDGQQRIRAVLDFVEDRYALSRSVVREYAGLKFSALPEDLQQRIRDYTFPCETLSGASDGDVLRIFARVNSYSVPLNAQELRNGAYFGSFKQYCYDVASDSVPLWRNMKIFTEAAIARMRDVELVSELTVAQLDGLQDKKASINRFYDQYDEDFPPEVQIRAQFENVVDFIGQNLAEVVTSTKFRRVPLFYTLFLLIHFDMHGLPNFKDGRPGLGLGLDEDYASRLSEVLVELSGSLEVDRGKLETLPNDEHVKFFRGTIGQTDNIGPRTQRLEAMIDLTR